MLRVMHNFNVQLLLNQTLLFQLNAILIKIALVMMAPLDFVNAGITVKVLDIAFHLWEMIYLRT